ncbi:MAG: hypothetical protein ACPGZU_05225 [Ketobacter sp.]
MAISSNDLDKTKVRQAVERALKESEPTQAYDWDRKMKELKAQYESDTRQRKHSA